MVKANSPGRVLDVHEVTALIGVSRATLHRWQQQGCFPSRRRIGPGRVGWLERDVVKFLESRQPVVAQADESGLRQT